MVATGHSYITGGRFNPRWISSVVWYEPIATTPPTFTEFRDAHCVPIVPIRYKQLPETTFTVHPIIYEYISTSCLTLINIQLQNGFSLRSHSCLLGIGVHSCRGLVGAMIVGKSATQSRTRTSAWWRDWVGCWSFNWNNRPSTESMDSWAAVPWTDSVDFSLCIELQRMSPSLGLCTVPT